MADASSLRLEGDAGTLATGLAQPCLTRPAGFGVFATHRLDKGGSGFPASYRVQTAVEQRVADGRPSGVRSPRPQPLLRPR